MDLCQNTSATVDSKELNNFKDTRLDNKVVSDFETSSCEDLSQIFSRNIVPAKGYITINGKLNFLGLNMTKISKFFIQVMHKMGEGNLTEDYYKIFQ